MLMCSDTSTQTAHRSPTVVHPGGQCAPVGGLRCETWLGWGHWRTAPVLVLVLVGQPVRSWSLKGGAARQTPSFSCGVSVKRTQMVPHGPRILAGR